MLKRIKFYSAWKCRWECWMHVYNFTFKVQTTFVKSANTPRGYFFILPPVPGLYSSDLCFSLKWPPNQQHFVVKFMWNNEEIWKSLKKLASVYNLLYKGHCCCYHLVNIAFQAPICSVLVYCKVSSLTICFTIFHQSVWSKTGFGLALDWIG